VHKDMQDFFCITAVVFTFSFLRYFIYVQTIGLDVNSDIFSAMLS